MIDLHCHSTYSDGSLPPAELVRLAVKGGLAALALTDHDTTEGLGEFIAAGQEAGFKAIPGVEISVDNDHGTLHMLGYGFRLDDAHLQDVLERIRDGREIRNREILDALRSMDIDITWEQLEAKSGEGVIGRPHFAQLLQEHGVVRSKREAFDRYLGKGKRAYRERFRLSAEESLESIRGAGGVAVLAHPSTLGLKPTALDRFVTELTELGLDGIEALYSEYSPDESAIYRKIAKEHGLMVTGGTDFHGTITPDLILGRGFGSMTVPDSVLDDLEQRLEKR